MRTILIGAFIGLATLALAGCSREPKKFKELGVDEVVQLQASTPVTFVDANGPDYRKENGIIPSAILLDSSSKYDTAVLPKDKAGALVFYCSNRL